MKLFGMGVTNAIKPKLVVESDGVHDQRISLPLSAGVTEPGGIEIFGGAAAVHENLPVGMHVPFDENYDQLGSLDNLERKRSVTRDGRGQAIRFRVIFREPLSRDLDGPRLQGKLLAGLEGVGDIAHEFGLGSPESGEVRLAIGGTRHRTSGLGFEAL